MGSTASASASTSYAEHHTHLRSADDVPTDMNGRRPQPGDLIEIFRNNYQHWAVYVGDGFVVHLVVPKFTIITDRVTVKKEDLRVVVGDNSWKINNSLDHTYDPRSADIIVREAKNLVGRETVYHSIRRNCEHFANEMRYGVSKSQQVSLGVKVFVRVGLGRLWLAYTRICSRH